MSILTRRAKGAPLTAEDHDRNLELAYGFQSLAALLADRQTHYELGSILAVRDGGFLYRVVDGSDWRRTHLTTAGGVELEVLPGSDGIYNIRAFGAVPDDRTDCYPAIWKAINAYLRGGGSGASGPQVLFPDGEYFCSRTVQFRSAVTLLGSFNGTHGNQGAARIRFPANTGGFQFNRLDTHERQSIYEYASRSAMLSSNLNSYTDDPDIGLASPAYGVGARILVTGEDTAWEVVARDDPRHDLVSGNGRVRFRSIDRTLLPSHPFTGADGSVLNGIMLRGGGASGSDKTAHGIDANCRIMLERIGISGFPGHGLHIYADTAHRHRDMRIYGNANMCQAYKVISTDNGQSGFCIRGYDANAGTFVFLDGMSNARYGMEERSFLGNTHIGHHFAVNGVATVNNPDDSSSFVGFGGRRYSAHADADERQLAEVEPGSDSSVWVDSGPDSASPHHQIPTWRPGRPAGTYFHGGPFIATGANARNVLLGVYTEGGQALTYISGPTLNLGGAQMGQMRGGIIAGSGGGELALNGIRLSRPHVVAEDLARSDAPEGTTITLREDEGSVVSWVRAGEGNVWRLQQIGKDWGIRYANLGAATALTITANDTDVTAGTGVAQKFLVVVRALGLGAGALLRRLTYGNTQPASGAAARGDIVFNASPGDGAPVGWACTDGGDPGSWVPFGQTRRAAAPTSGSWARGDIVYNEAPAPGGHVGWVCVESGAPGSWKGFGLISA